jgi:hypothetical protein
MFAFLVGSPAAAHSADAFGCPTVWLMADLDGDRKLDIAIVSPASPAGEGRHSLSVRFGGLDLPASTDLLFAACHRLKVRDVDGDSDRDIVLQTVSGEPLAVWINDGTGQFEERDIESFRFLLSNDDPRILVSPEQLSSTGQNAECAARDAISSRYAGLDTRLRAAMLTAAINESPGCVDLSIVRQRGPPGKSKFLATF